MKIIAHRAINKKYPENSLESIKWAFSKGYGIETDIRVNKNGNLVIIHDDTGERLFGTKKKIIDMTDEETSKLSYKNNKKIKITTFRKVCEAYKKIKAKGKFMCLHVKDINEPKVVEKTAAILREFKIKDDTFIFAVDEQTMPLINLVNKKYPDIKVGLHLPENSPFYSEKYFRMCDVVWVDEVSGKWYSEKMNKLAKKLGKKIYCMSPEFVPNNIFQKNYKIRWKDMVKMNFDGIVTDYPKELEKFLQYF